MLEDKISNVKMAKFSPSSHYTIQDIYEKRPDMFSNSKVHIYYTEKDGKIWEGKLVDLAKYFDSHYREYDVECFKCLNQYRPCEFIFILRTPTHDDSPDSLRYYRYYKNDIEATLEAARNIHPCLIPKLHYIEKVICQPPATIIFWSDGSKTVVKTESTDEYDIEKGVLYAIIKRISSKKEYENWLKTIDQICDINLSPNSMEFIDGITFTNFKK